MARLQELVQVHLLHRAGGRQRQLRVAGETKTHRHLVRCQFLRVGNANHLGGAHRGMAHQRLLQLDRGDVDDGRAQVAGAELGLLTVYGDIGDGALAIMRRG